MPLMALIWLKGVRTMSKIREWPYGLLEAVFIGGSLPVMPESFPEDLNASVEYAVNLLDANTSHIMYERFKQGMTLEAISQIHGVSRERIRQIVDKGLRKLRHPSICRYIRYGVSGVLRTEKIEAADTARKRASEQNIKKILGDCIEKGVTAVEQMDLLDTPIQQLDLSTRSCNGLIRGGCETLGDVLNLSGQQLMALRCIGEKSRKEIISMLEGKGFDCKHLRENE